MMTNPVDEPEVRNEKSRTDALVLIFAAVLAPAIYVLALGPLIWATEKEMIPEAWYGFLTLVYAPLAWLSDHFKWAEIVLYWYVGLWD